MMRRRGFLAGILAAGFAPAAIGSGVLMPVRKIIVPPPFDPAVFMRVPAEASAAMQLAMSALVRRGEAFVKITSVVDTKGLAVGDVVQVAHLQPGDMLVATEVQSFGRSPFARIPVHRQHWM